MFWIGGFLLLIPIGLLLQFVLNPKIGIKVGTYVYMRKFPELNFKQALRRSLIEVGPAWIENHHLIAIFDAESEGVEDPDTLVNIARRIETGYAT